MTRSTLGGVLLTAIVAILVVLFFFLDSSDPRQDAGLEGRLEELPAVPTQQPHEVFAENAGEPEGENDRRALEPGSSKQPTKDVPETESPPQSGDLAADLEATLHSFYGEQPKLEDLRRLVAQLAKNMDSESFSPTEDGFVGTFGIEGTALQGSVTRSGNESFVEVQQAFGDRDYVVRSLSIIFSEEAGMVSSGRIGVEHHLDPRDPAVLSRLVQQPQIVGWVASTTKSTGTRAAPVVATSSADESSMTVTASGHGVPAIHQEWAWDMSPFEAWNARLPAGD